MLYLFIAAGLTAVDQLVKFLVRAQIPLHTSVPFLPGVMNLTYYQNTGAAFSMLNEHTWILTIISAVVSLVVVVAILKKGFSHWFGSICLSLILGGAVGNLIDRAFLGFVTDMFQTTFISFAIFNVADICVVVGGIALCVYLVFFYEKLEKRSVPHGDTSPDR